MSLELSSDQRRAVDYQGTPLEISDRRTGIVYVLVDRNVFDRVQTLLLDDLAETYPAQIESAMRAGWNDPIMDEYNDYDRHRKQCGMKTGQNYFWRKSVLPPVLSCSCPVPT